MIPYINGLTFGGRLLIFAPFLFLWGLFCFIAVRAMLLNFAGREIHATFLSITLFFLLGVLVVFNVLFLPELTFPPMGNPWLFFGGAALIFVIGVLAFLIASPKEERATSPVDAENAFDEAFDDGDDPFA